MPERASTPLPEGIQPNYRVVVEISQPSVEVIAGEDDYFDLSLDSLESNCKKMKVDTGFGSVNSRSYPCSDWAPEPKVEMNFQIARKVQSAFKTRKCSSSKAIYPRKLNQYRAVANYLEQRHKRMQNRILKVHQGRWDDWGSTQKNFQTI